MRDTMVLEGLTEEEANNAFWTLDYRGLLTDQFEDEVLDFQKPYLRTSDEVEGWARDEKDKSHLLKLFAG